MHCRIHKELLSQHQPFIEENKLNSRARFKRQRDQKITDAVHLLKSGILTLDEVNNREGSSIPLADIDKYC